MRKILAALAVVAAVTLATTGVGHAVNMTRGATGLGFFDQNAPVGGIYWFSPKAALAVGVGFNKPDEGDTEFDLTVGIPINVLGNSRANLQVRPRIFFATNTPVGSGTGDFLSVGGDLAVELFLAEHLSVVAGHGAEFQNVSPEVGDSVTTINTRVVSGSSVGFFYYFKM